MMSAARRHDLKVAIKEAIKSFDFADYGMDEVPHYEVDWVNDLTNVIADKIEEI